MLTWSFELLPNTLFRNRVQASVSNTRRKQVDYLLLDFECIISYVTEGIGESCAAFPKVLRIALLQAGGVRQDSAKIRLRKRRHSEIIMRKAIGFKASNMQRPYSSGPLHESDFQELHGEVPPDERQVASLVQFAVCGQVGPLDDVQVPGESAQQLVPAPVAGVPVPDASDRPLQ